MLDHDKYGRGQQSAFQRAHRRTGLYIFGGGAPPENFENFSKILKSLHFLHCGSENLCMKRVRYEEKILGILMKQEQV